MNEENTTDQQTERTNMAALILAHDKPVQLRRLIAALGSFPIFLHVDGNVPPERYAELVEGLPEHVYHLPRVPSGWAHFGLIQATLNAFRTALETTDAQHFAVLTGADYPLASAETIGKFLAEHPDTSFGDIRLLPIPEWGPTRGYDRFYLRNWPANRRRMASLPRLVPRGLRPAGGAQAMMLCRRHAQLVVDTLSEREDLMRFFRWVWAPDESVAHSILLSPALGGESDQSVFGPHLWHVEWKPKRSNPEWLTDFERLRAARFREGTPTLFARKFADDSDELIERIDTELRR